MRYAAARWQEDAEREAYRIYVTDALRLVTENTGRAVQDGHYLTVRYYDVIHPPKLDTRTGDEIAADVISRMGLEVKRRESV